MIKPSSMKPSPTRVASRHVRARRYETENLTIRVRENHGWVHAELWPEEDIGYPVGKVSARPEAPYEPADFCQEDRDILTAKYGDLPMWVVYKSIVDWPIQGQGWGKKLYEALFAEIKRRVGPTMISAHACLGGSGATSDQAKGVWRSLARKYPASGLVVVIR